MKGARDLLRVVDMDDAVTRELYAYYGLAMYYAQGLEHGMVNLLVAIRRVKEPGAGYDDIEAFFDKGYKLTLGTLLKDVGRHIDIPEEFDGLFRDAMKGRNHLVHNYFRERAEEMRTMEGKRAIIEDLHGYQNLFCRAGSLVDAITVRLMEHLGITRETVEREIRRMRGL